VNFRDETKWRNLMFACHHATAGDGREEFIQWSTDDPMYANDEWRIGRRWDSLHTDKPGAITVGTLNHFLREAGAVNAQVPNEVGDDFDGEADVPKNEIAPIETRGLRLNSKGIAPDTYTNALAAIDKARLAPAWNELAQVVECRAKELPWPKHYGHVLNDHVARLVRALLAQQFQGVGYEPGKDNVFEAIFTIAYQNKFNPILDYLDSLKWDGVARVENLFGTYFNCGSGKYIRAVSKCFMVGAVARQRRPGCKFDTMPVLQGKQGEGKSDGMKRLAGPEWFDDSDLGNLHDKDAAMKLRGIWLKEFAEIDSLTRAGANALKAFLSSATDRQRDPYGRIVETYPRRCVFFGTVNESGYLRDPTGGRRYWPLEVLAPIDLDRISADRDQLWAEANMMQARGDSHVLPETLWPEAGKRQAEQTTNDPWADKLRDYLEQREEDWADYQLGEAADLEPLPPDRVHSSELFEALGIKEEQQSKDRAQRIRTTMEATLGWKHRASVRIGKRIRNGYVRGSADL
jgi:predicted P-loop ATPase